VKLGRYNYGRHCIAVLVTLILFRADVAWGVDLAKYFKRPDQRGAELLENGQPEQAATEFRDPQWRGVSRYLAGQYNDAMQDFAIAVDPDAPNQADASELYNHGTAAARAGDYNQAVSSLEQALKLAPEDKKISHNLEIAKKLKDLAENQQQDQQQDQSGDSRENKNENKDESEDQSSESDDSQSQSSDEESDQSSDGEPEDSQNNNQNPSDNNGELSADQNSQSPEQKQEQEEQQQNAEELREMMQQEQQSGEQEPQKEVEAEVPVQSSVSEDDQATQQWLRRIPDDASQLLRNKIRLNHIIEYPDVQDMQEPW